MSESSIAKTVTQNGSNAERDLAALQSPQEEYEKRKEVLKNNCQKAFDEWDAASSVAGDPAQLKEVLAHLHTRMAELESLVPPGPREEHLFQESKRRVIQGLMDSIVECIGPQAAIESLKKYGVEQQPSPQEETSRDLVEPTSTSSVSLPLGSFSRSEHNLRSTIFVHPLPRKSPSSVSVLVAVLF